MLLLPMPEDGTLRELLVDAAMVHHLKTGDTCVLNYFPNHAYKHTQCVLYEGKFCWVVVGKINIPDSDYTYKVVQVDNLNPGLLLNMTAPAEILASLIDLLN